MSSHAVAPPHTAQGLRVPAEVPRLGRAAVPSEASLARRQAGRGHDRGRGTGHDAGPVPARAAGPSVGLVRYSYMESVCKTPLVVCPQLGAFCAGSACEALLDEARYGGPERREISDIRRRHCNLQADGLDRSAAGGNRAAPGRRKQHLVRTLTTLSSSIMTFDDRPEARGAPDKRFNGTPSTRTSEDFWLP